MSNFSDWTIPEQALAELTNGYVNEQGIIRQRPGFYCWLDSVSTSKDILGATNYKKWIEGGATEYFVFNTNNKIYYSTKAYVNTNTDISGGLTFSDDGIPVWEVYFNRLFMANGEENPIEWDQDGNITQLARCTYSGAIKFIDSNSLSSTSSFESGAYHFRPSMDLVITDSNNNGTYEIVSVDANVIVITTTAGANPGLTAQSDSSVSLVGYSYPPELSSTTRTESVTFTTDNQLIIYSKVEEVIGIKGVSWYDLGFRAGMTLEISNSFDSEVDGNSYTISSVSYDFYPGVEEWNEKNFIVLDGIDWTEAYLRIVTRDPDTVFTGTNTITTADAFNPSCICGHKSRFFAGGVKELPTYLFYSACYYFAAYFYDIWRDRFGHTDGTGYFDLGDKIIALIPEFNDDLIILCENSIWRLRGDDPGTDILTPSQSYVFHPVPISKDIGCLGPNAWCRVGNDIYFYAKSGFNKLSTVEQYGDMKAVTLSLPINDLHDSILENANLRKINLEYLKDLNMVFISCGISSFLNDSLITYNIANNTFSKWTFTSGSEPSCLFLAKGAEIDPNETDIPNNEANPYETLWFGSQDGKLFSLHKDFCYDRDYEDPNDPNNYNVSMTVIAAKQNFGDPFLKKTFRRAVFSCSPQINYSTSSGGAVSLYRKIDDGSWSAAVSKSFTTHSDTAGSAIDYYEFLDFGVGIAGSGHTISYKIVTSGTTSRFGCDIMGIMTEYEPIDWRI